MLKLICEDSPEAILSAVYEAWALPTSNNDIELVINGEYQQELFAEYHNAQKDPKLAARVAESIRKKLSFRIWSMVWHALMAAESDKAQAIFVFLRTAFRTGPAASEQYARPEVMRVVELDRMVSREQQHLEGFVRFAQAQRGILIAGITPTHRQVPLLAAHFSDRFPQERFIIYDKKRGEAAVHEPGAGWYLTDTDRIDLLEAIIQNSEQDLFSELWRTFFKGIAISQRSNRACQDNLLPKRFRADMTEFAQPKAAVKPGERAYSLTGAREAVSRHKAAGPAKLD